MTDTDPGIAQLNKWGEDHPLLFGTIRALSLWAILQGVAFFIPPVGVLANGVLLIWAMVLLYINRDRCLPVIERAWDAVFAAALKTYQNVSRGTQSESVATPSAFVELEAVAELPRVQWDAPAQDDAHAQYRIQYERLVDVIPSLSRDDQGEARHDRRKTLLTLAEILDGLHIYGDDPLAWKPPAPLPAPPEPAPRPMGFAGLPVPGFTFPFSWALAAVLAVVGAVQTVRVERVKDDVRDLRETVAAETDRANAAETQARMNEVALESTRHEVNVSRDLLEAQEARERRLAERQRRSSNAQVNAARTGSAVDLDNRLRDFTLQPFASPDPGASATPDPAGGMHERPASALDLSTPDALPTGDDGASARDSNVPG